VKVSERGLLIGERLRVKGHSKSAQEAREQSIAAWVSLCYRNASFSRKTLPMPTYEYQCQKCHKVFEMYQSMKDDALSTCPKEHCQRKTWGKGKVKRLLGPGAGLIFKGSGFYITDYRSEGYKASAKSESKGEGKATETKKTDSKPVPAEKPKAAPKKESD
jgi:putative FmdB family regulatory protein